MPTARHTQRIQPAPAAQDDLNADDFMRPSDFGGGGYYDLREHAEPAAVKEAPSHSTQPVASEQPRFMDEVFGFSLDAGDPAAAILDHARRNIGRKSRDAVVQPQVAVRSSSSNKPRKPIRSVSKAQREAPPPPPKAPLQALAVRVDSDESRGASSGSSSGARSTKPSRPGWRGTTGRACGWKTLEEIHEAAKPKFRRTQRRSANTVTHTPPAFAATTSLLDTVGHRALSDTYPPPRHQPDSALSHAYPTDSRPVELQRPQPAVHTQRREFSAALSIREQLSQTKLRLEASLGGSYAAPQ